MPPLKSDHNPEQSLGVSWNIITPLDSFNVVKRVKDNIAGIRESAEVVKYKQIRIYLLRHYPESKVVWKHYAKLEEIPEEERERFKRAYDGIFSNPDKILFIYDDQEWLERVRATAKDLLNKYCPSIPESHIIRDISLRGTYDDTEKPLVRKKRTIEEMMDLEAVFKERNLSDIDTIVIVGNRTYCEPFDLLSGGKKDLTQQLLETRWYQYRDFDYSLSPIIPTSTSLVISPEIYRYLHEIFGIQSNSCQELQSKLEKLFMENSDLFQKYLTNSSSPASLRTFCLANLIKKKEYSAIEEYSFANCITLTPEEKELFLQNTQDSNIKSILRKLFVCKEKLWADTDNKLFDTEFYSLLKNSRAAYNTAKSLQWNSLDPFINKWENGAILDRKLYFEEKDKSEKNINSNKNNSQEKEIIVRRNFDPNMFRKGKYSRFIIRGHVGEWKSMYLSELVKEFSLEEEDNIEFVIAKDIKDVEGLFTPNNPDILICIDALDEANDTIKVAIKAQMREFKGRVIVTTRYTESFDPDMRACTLYFNPIESDEYIDSKIHRKWYESHGSKRMAQETLIGSWS